MLTSSYENTGINELFIKLGELFLKQYYKENLTSENHEKNNVILNNEINNNNQEIKKKKCCRKN